MVHNVVGWAFRIYCAFRVFKREVLNQPDRESQSDLASRSRVAGSIRSLCITGYGSSSLAILWIRDSAMNSQSACSLAAIVAILLNRRFRSLSLLSDVCR